MQSHAATVPFWKFLPPPPILPVNPDPITPKTATIDDEKWIKSFLNKINENNIEILINKLVSLKDDLTKNKINYSSAEWEGKLSEIKKIKLQIEEKSNLNSRKNMKRKKKVNKKPKSTKIIKSNLKSKALDKEIIVKPLENEDNDETSKKYLVEIKKHKENINKKLKLLTEIKNLRSIRQSNNENKGFNERDFILKLENIKAKWTIALNQLNNDEKEVINYLNKKKRLKMNWENILFTKNYKKNQININLNHFIYVRQQWDIFLSADGTKIPTGFILPNQNPSDKWRDYCNEI